MANVTPTVLLVSRDPEVKHVSSVLQAEGITSRNVSSVKELERAFAAAEGHLRRRPRRRARRRSRPFPPPRCSSACAACRCSCCCRPRATARCRPTRSGPAFEEYARKPIAPSVLAMRIKVLILAAGLELPVAPQHSRGAARRVRSTWPTIRAANSPSSFRSRAARARARSPSTWPPAWRRCTRSRRCWSTPTCGSATSACCST